MASENSFPIVGIDPPDLAAAAPGEALAFRKRTGELAVHLLRDQMRRGIGRDGQPLVPVKPSSRPDGAKGKPLVPHNAASRSSRWLRFSIGKDGVTLWWSHGWARILGYHRRGEGHLPVRDVGPSDATLRKLKRAMAMWWQARHRVPIVAVPRQPALGLPQRAAPRPGPTTAGELIERYPHLAQFGPRPGPGRRPAPVRLEGSEPLAAAKPKGPRKPKRKPAPAQAAPPPLRIEPASVRAAAAARPAILPGRPIAERLAAYEAGDRHLAGIRALETPLGAAEATRIGALARLEAARVQLDAAARGVAGATSPELLGPLKDEYRRAESEQAAARDEASRIREEARALLRAAIGAANPQKWEHSGGALQNPRTARTFDAARAFLEPLVESYPVNRPSRLGWETDEKLNRAFYKTTTAAVHITVWDSPSTAVHEWGHHLETAFPGIGRQAKLYLEHRVGAEAPKPLGGSFARDEAGRDDDFGRYFDATRARYAGKVYGDADPAKASATEMLSMGLEALHKDPVGFAARDPEYAKWVVGILTGELR